MNLCVQIHMRLVIISTQTHLISLNNCSVFTSTHIIAVTLKPTTTTTAAAAAPISLRTCRPSMVFWFYIVTIIK